MMSKKPVKMGLCGIHHLVHKSPKRLANQDLDGRKIGLSSSIFEFMKPRCSLWDNKKKKKKRQLSIPHQPEMILKSISKFTLQDWILNSPSLNTSGNKIHPSFEESVEVTTSILRPGDSLSLDRVKLQANDEIKMEEDASIVSSKSKSGKRKKVSFRLPEVADIFMLDSSDGYYYSK